MTIQENIKKKAEGFGKLSPLFLEGAKYALENQWISVEDDLPYNHKDLLFMYENDMYTEPVLIIDEFNCYDIATMELKNNEWIWNYPVEVTAWLEIPKYK